MMKVKYWWERLYNVIPSEKKTVHEFMEENDFLWEVISLPCYTIVNDEYVMISDNVVCARSDTMKPMYVVKKRYRLLNNEECFDVCNEFMKKYKNCKFISCGDILNEKKSYMTILLKTIKICNDDCNVYITVTNGFDGRNAVNCSLTIIRNKDHSVIQIFDKEHKRVWTMGRLDTSKKIEKVFDDIENYIDYVTKICIKMNNKQIDLNTTINPLFDLNWMNHKRKNRYLAEEKEYIREIYINNKGQTLFDLYMAMSNYYCNVKLKRNGKLGDDKRFDMAMIKYFYTIYDYLKSLLKLNFIENNF